MLCRLQIKKFKMLCQCCFVVLGLQWRGLQALFDSQFNLMQLFFEASSRSAR